MSVLKLYQELRPAEAEARAVLTQQVATERRT